MDLGSWYFDTDKTTYWWISLDWTTGGSSDFIYNCIVSCCSWDGLRIIHFCKTKASKKPIKLTFVQ